MIAGRWMVSGLREVTEYRDHVLGCFVRVAKAPTGTSGDPLVH